MTLKKSRIQPKSIDLEQACWRLPDDAPVPESTAELMPDDAIIGQERALKALRLGLELYKPGYNVFVCGIAGTGRTSTVKRILASMQPSCELADDLAYVHNFDDPERPRLITLPRGEANDFRTLVHDSLRLLRNEIDQLINSPETAERMKSIEISFKVIGQKLTTDFREKIGAAGFALAASSAEGTVVPELVLLMGETMVDMRELPRLVAEEKMTEEEARKHSTKAEELESDLVTFMAEHQRISRDLSATVSKVRRHVVRLAIRGFRSTILEKFPSKPAEEWLEQIRDTLLDNLEIFERREGDTEGGEVEAAGPDFSAFDVNIILANKGAGCPIVVENHPNFQNLFGSQDRVAMAPGVFGTDFSRIRPGSLLRAQGGYLIITAADMLMENSVWPQLKQTLRSGELTIQPQESGGAGGAPVLTPDPIALNVKVILLGSNLLYESLHEKDHEFAKIFKVKADFDTSIGITDESLRRYLIAMVRIVRVEELAELDRSGIEAFLQFSMRQADRRGRLSTRFSELSDVLLEADFAARKDGAKVISGKHIEDSIMDARERLSLYEDKLKERIDFGEIILETDGFRVGQINGLTVMSIGEYSFGTVARISCRTSAGKNGLVDLEREADLSGSSYDKGSMIIQGFMNGRYGQDFPLTFGASICIEQSYGYIDGDSASSTELFLLLSTLADIPLRQDLACTGSVDQFGNIQPVGGINEKIEGFFDVCHRRGLTGTQGIVMPQANLSDLMLSRRAREAIDQGQFHVYPISSIDEGLEIFTGFQAGNRTRTGAWPTGSVNGEIQAALERFHKMGGDG
ncbi:MAG: putative ATP-dependent protease [Planctomycetota bacterium]|jgi:predicted ATP-dependent protease